MHVPEAPPHVPPSLTLSEVKGRTSCEMNPTQLPEHHFMFWCARVLKKRRPNRFHISSSFVGIMLIIIIIVIILMIGSFLRRCKAVCRWKPRPLTRPLPSAGCLLYRMQAGHLPRCKSGCTVKCLYERPRPSFQKSLGIKQTRVKSTPDDAVFCCFSLFSAAAFGSNHSVNGRWKEKCFTEKKGETVNKQVPKLLSVTGSEVTALRINFSGQISKRMSFFF